MDHCTSVPHPLFTLESGRPAHLPVVSACSVPRNISTLSTSYNRLTFKQVFPGYLSFPVHSLLDFSRWPIFFFMCLFFIDSIIPHLYSRWPIFFMPLFVIGTIIPRLYSRWPILYASFVIDSIIQHPYSIFSSSRFAHLSSEFSSCFRTCYNAFRFPRFSLYKNQCVNLVFWARCNIYPFRIHPLHL